MFVMGGIMLLIPVSIHEEGFGFSGKIEHRVPLWTALDRLSGNGPWIVLGYFNNVLYANERLGKAVSDEEMLPFQSTVARCDLHDMKTTGAFFTWNNKQPSETRIFSRIDRVLANSDWLALWSDWLSHYQPEGTFDHCPCIVSCGESCKRRKRYFKFFNMWSRVEEFGELVKEYWQMQITGTPMYIMARKLKMLKPCPRSLNRGLFSDIERNTDVAFNLLIDCQLQLQNDPTNVILMDKEKQLRESYQLMKESRTDFLKQKAKCAWAREGDTNSAMFYQALQHRQMHNKVLHIESMSGVDCRDPDDILKAFLAYYETLLRSSAPTSGFYKSIVTQGVTLDESDWLGLCSIPTEEEIRKVVFSIPNEKSPSPDGLSGCLPKIINPAQCAFIKGRSILVNIFISQDLVRLYERKSASPRCLMKVDLRKAYDSIEWDFVANMSLRMTHLMFADDLLLFYKGEVLKGTGFKKGSLPFKYLGVNISHKRLTKSDCNNLVDMMIFVLPIGAVDRIQALCRNFLWEGSDKYSKAPLVNWNVLCQSKEHGGLGLIDSKQWNIEAIGKLVWWLATKQDHLWIRWVDNVYLKGKDWMLYEPFPSSSWAWRKICDVKNIYKPGYAQGKWCGDDCYTIANGYDWLRQEHLLKVQWYSVVWNRYNVPKWSFTMWLQQQQRLLTLDRLTKMGMEVPTECFLCGTAPESHSHLFSECVYTLKCHQLLADWLQLPKRDIVNCVKIAKKHG
ncbi:uncharacterized protein LOC141614342 [Silene latifolia]|uniref:uncharacterized protein LOC141614342 n=1 Tax=Silene latifolia TaxID=37657 RepID=UPI003D77B52C